MIKYLTILFLLFSVACFGQAEKRGTIKVKKAESARGGDTINTVDEAYASWNVIAMTAVDIMPTFMGGEKAMQAYIQKSLKYPEAEKKARIEGTVYVTFLVQIDGSIAFVGFTQGVVGGDGLNKEAMRIVRLMPNWSPGKNNGKSVPVKCTLPIKFQL